MNRQYIGARYVPKFFDDGKGSSEWVSGLSYEPLTVVTHLGNSFTSKKPVPVGVDIMDTEYWCVTGNYNEQIEGYRKTAEMGLKIANDAKTVAENNKYPFIVVDKNGGGNFTSLTEAVKSANKYFYCFIMPGTYECTIDFTNFEHVILIGADKNNCFLYNNSGIYKEPVLNMNGNFLIYNLSISAYGNPNFTPTFNNNDVLNTYPSYAIHADNTVLTGGIMTIENCNIVSTSGPCIGAGVQHNQTLYITNCDINRQTINNTYRANDNLHDGAVLIHNSNLAGENQFCNFYNNSVRCDYTPVAIFKCDIAISEYNFTLFARNNTFYDYIDKSNNIMYYKGNSKLLSGCYGNNVIQLNNTSSLCEPITFKNSIAISGSDTEISIDLTNFNLLNVGFRESANYNTGGSLLIPVARLIAEYENGNFTPIYYVKLEDDSVGKLTIVDLTKIKISTTSSKYVSTTVYGI